MSFATSCDLGTNYRAFSNLSSPRPIAVPGDRRAFSRNDASLPELTGNSLPEAARLALKV
jgi:hypothetical protein